MLSDKQCEIISTKVNRETDIPLLSESAEDKIIDKVLSTVNPLMEPALRAFCPPGYVDCLKIALAEGIDEKDKREQISRIMRKELAEPMAERMAGSLDVAMVPEYMEQKVLEVVTQKIVDEFIEWTVGEIDDRMNKSLENTRSEAREM